jgi:hypothetical protein
MHHGKHFEDFLSVTRIRHGRSATINERAIGHDYACYLRVLRGISGKMAVKSG